MPANGHMINGTPIAVDLWQQDRCPEARIFFLSHFHSDHTYGLTRHWDFPIYTSKITADLVIKKLGVRSSLVKVLTLGQEHVISLDIEGKETLSVTLYDANHCPGAVMFLFQGYFGNIFYTADFRYIPEMLDFSALPRIDVLYLDNTYCSPKCEFPRRQDAVEELLDRVQSCLAQSERVVIGLDGLGKEDIFHSLVKETHYKLHVSQKRKETLDILGLSSLVTCNKKSTEVLIVSTNEINASNIKIWNSEVPTHAILVTARYCGFAFRPYARFENIHVVQLSNHSSFKELKQFVQLIKPKAIVPIISKNARGMFNSNVSDRADMSVFSEYLSGEPFSEFVIPESVKIAMDLWKLNSEGLQHITQRRSVQERIDDTEEAECINISNELYSNSQSYVTADQTLNSSSSKEIWEIVCIGNT